MKKWIESYKKRKEKKAILEFRALLFLNGYETSHLTDDELISGIQQGTYGTFSVAAKSIALAHCAKMMSKASIALEKLN